MRASIPVRGRQPTSAPGGPAVVARLRDMLLRGTGILSTIGWILIVVGLILLLLGAVDRSVGPRRYYW
jgi:hypothetical protein